MIGAFARLTITARDTAVFAPPAVVRGRARAVGTSARSNATGAITVAEVVFGIVGLDEDAVGVAGRRRGGELDGEAGGAAGLDGHKLSAEGNIRFSAGRGQRDLNRDRVVL